MTELLILWNGFGLIIAFFFLIFVDIDKVDDRKLKVIGFVLSPIIAITAFLAYRLTCWAEEEDVE